MKHMMWVLLGLVALNAAYVDAAQPPSHVIQAVTEFGADSQIVFTLDNLGEVFGFVIEPASPKTITNWTKISSLQNIKSIVPYAAIDANGNVFTWEISDMDSDQGIIQNISFTDAHKLVDIEHVNEIVNLEQHYAAISNNSDVYVWTSGSGYADAHHIQPTAPKKIYSGTKVKKISINWAYPRSTAIGYLILLEDGTLVGINTDSYGQVLQGKTMDWNPTAIGNFKGAKDLQANDDSTAIIMDDGATIFVNHCETHKKDISGTWVPVKGVHEEKGDLTNVVAIGKSIAYHQPNYFIKADGTVWTEWSHFHVNYKNECSSQTSIKGFDNFSRPALKIDFQTSASDVMPKAVFIYGNLVIDSEYRLWSTFYDLHYPYVQVKLNQ